MAASATLSSSLYTIVSLSHALSVTCLVGLTCCVSHTCSLSVSLHPSLGKCPSPLVFLPLLPCIQIFVHPSVLTRRLSLSLSVFRSLTRYLSPFLTGCLSHSPSRRPPPLHAMALSHSSSLSLAIALSHGLSLLITPCLSLFLSYSLSLSLCLSLSLVVSLTLFVSLTCCLSHSFLRHSVSHLPSLARSPPNVWWLSLTLPCSH